MHSFALLLAQLRWANTCPPRGEPTAQSAVGRQAREQPPVLTALTPAPSVLAVAVLGTLPYFILVTTEMSAAISPASVTALSRHPSW